MLFSGLGIVRCFTCSGHGQRPFQFSCLGRLRCLRCLRLSCLHRILSSCCLRSCLVGFGHSRSHRPLFRLLRLGHSRSDFPLFCLLGARESRSLPLRCGLFSPPHCLLDRLLDRLLNGSLHRTVFCCHLLSALLPRGLDLLFEGGLGVAQRH